MKQFLLNMTIALAAASLLAGCAIRVRGTWKT